MKEVTFTKEASKALSALPRNVSEAIFRKVHQYAADPASLANNVKRLRGMAGVLRLRVGDWRVIFTDDGRVLAVLRVAPRGSVYD